MSGLFRRLRRDRHASPEPAAPRTAPADAMPADGRPYTEGHAHEEATLVLEPAGPAGEDLDAMVGPAPGTRRRGRLRRRLRHLRRIREVLMRDLGGFVFEVHRSSAAGSADSVVDSKLRRLASVDAEIRELESALDDRRPLVLREAGIGGACPRCGEVFGSEARFCWACGTPVAAGAGHVPRLPSPDARTRIGPAPGGGLPEEAEPRAAAAGTWSAEDPEAGRTPPPGSEPVDGDVAADRTEPRAEDRW